MWNDICSYLCDVRSCVAVEDKIGNSVEPWFAFGPFPDWPFMPAWSLTITWKMDSLKKRKEKKSNQFFYCSKRGEYRFLRVLFVIFVSVVEAVSDHRKEEDCNWLTWVHHSWAGESWTDPLPVLVLSYCRLKLQYSAHYTRNHSPRSTAGKLLTFCCCIWPVRTHSFYHSTPEARTSIVERLARKPFIEVMMWRLTVMKILKTCYWGKISKLDM